MKKKLKKPILAEGEVTGHFHELQGDVDVYELKDGVKEFSLDKPTKLTHQEHNIVKLPKDEYLSDQVVEYDHLLDESRRVAD